MTDRVTLREAQEITGFGYAKLRRLIAEGTLQAWKRGARLIVVEREDLARIDQPL